MRAQQEWRRYGKGAWNYEQNDATLRAFWRAGHRAHGHAREHRHARHARRRRHADDRRAATSRCSSASSPTSGRSSPRSRGKDASQTPQLWALYKEVQDYYDKGMRVPDDVTLLFSDDNWGNIRRLPAAADRSRAGRLRRLLPLRLRRRPAQLQVDQHEPDRARLGADAPRVRVRREPDLDRQRRRPQADGVPDPVLPRLRVESARAGRPSACRSTRASGPSSSSARARAGDRRHRHDATSSTPAAGSRSCSTPETYSLANYREAERVVADYDALRRARRAARRRSCRPIPRRVLPARAAPGRRPRRTSTSCTSPSRRIACTRSRGARRRTSSPTACAALFERDAEISRVLQHASSPAASGPT